MAQNEGQNELMKELKNMVGTMKSEESRRTKVMKPVKVMVEDKKKMEEEKEGCARCGNKFREKCDLEKHVRKDHEFRCNQCDEEFRCGNQLVEPCGTSSWTSHKCQAFCVQ